MSHCFILDSALQFVQFIMVMMANRTYENHVRAVMNRWWWI